MKKIIIALLALQLTACANIQNAWEAATTATVSPTVVVVAANTFDALEVTATNYLRLPKCGNVSSNICRNPNATQSIIKAVRSGRVARNNLEQFLKDHPGELGSKGAYDALQASISTLQYIFSQYNIK